MNFGRVCAANFLLFASVYMLFPILPMGIMPQVGEVSLPQVGMVFPAFVVGMWAVGPFHAYLGDTYKRKHVLVYSTWVILASMLGYAFSDAFWKMLALAFVQGAAFGLAVTAGITVAIDITVSARRSAGNMAYVWVARMGMLMGAGTGVLVCRMYDFRTTVYLAIAVGLLSIVFASRVYVAFRAPIGVKLCNIDRFLLVHAWVPAINLMLFAFAAGVLMLLLWAGTPEMWVAALSAIALLVILSVPFTRMFVKLSHHCQRGTANTTCHLAMDTGLLLGLYVACRMGGFSISRPESEMMYWAAAAVILAVLFLVSITLSYYKRYRVR